MSRRILGSFPGDDARLKVLESVAVVLEDREDVVDDRVEQGVSEKGRVPHP